MAKRLNTTVAVTDPETGETTVLGPKDKLQSGDVSYLEEIWGKRSGEFLEDDSDDDEPSEERRALGGGPLPSDPLRADLPQPDRVPDTLLAEGGDAPSVEEGQTKMQEARGDANNAEGKRTGQGGRAASSK